MRTAFRRALAMLAGVILLSTASASSASAATATETFGDYSMMFSRSAGQYWSGGAVGGQWAWSPQSATESWIYWGDPAAWPPIYREQFTRVGDWVMLLGWWDHGNYYTHRVTTEWTANADCATNKQKLPVGGGQHYVKWAIPTAGYCLFAQGTITESGTGTVWHFQHQQVWSPAGLCGNAYQKPRQCLRQSEQWWDDIYHPYGLQLSRSSYLGKGAGMAWKVDQSQPGVWSTGLKYEWTY